MNSSSATMNVLPTLEIPAAMPAPLARRIPVSRAAALVAAAVWAGLGVIEVARAVITPTQHGAGLVSFIVVLASALSTAAFVKGHSSRVSVATGSAFVILAHGITLALGAERVGPLFAGLAPVLVGLAHASIPSEWESRLESALRAARVASRNRHATRA